MKRIVIEKPFEPVVLAQDVSEDKFYLMRRKNDNCFAIIYNTEYTQVNYRGFVANKHDGSAFGLDGMSLKEAVARFAASHTLEVFEFDTAKAMYQYLADHL